MGDPVLGQLVLDGLFDVVLADDFAKRFWSVGSVEAGGHSAGSLAVFGGNVKFSNGFRMC